MLKQQQQETPGEARLQGYLDSLEKPLATLGEAARREWRSEAEGHLRSLVAAHEELGATQEEAVESALARFGASKQIGSRMRQATLRYDARQNPAARITERVIKCSAGALLPALVSFLTFVLLYVYTDNLAAQAAARGVVTAALLAGPLVNGWLLGGILPSLRNQVRRLQAAHGSASAVRLKVEWAAWGAATTVQLGLFWAMLRILSEGSPPRFLAADFLPALCWMPVTLGVAFWRGRRLTAAGSGTE
jgi:hypothetical protein